ncbi:MAG: hydroxymethylbilane synthase [Chloroflexi bacterium]|nr:MAG: hydroxymethylbilane synthase [Chloroflexota bacterium]
MKRITIGTRASKLAMIQTNWVAEQLHRQWPDLEIEILQIRTTGDRVTNVPLSQIGGDGVFVTEIERALQEDRIDLAVHSLKDLPTAQPDGLRIVVPGPREDVRDVFVSSLPVRLVDVRLHTNTVTHTALRIGTCSLRRTAQLRTICPDAQILSVRGNVDTRLRKLAAGDYDGIVLASAGLHRLNLHTSLSGRMTYFPVSELLPAPGQGALALEIRDEPAMRALLAPLHDSAVQAATSAERMFMRRLGAGCYLPVAAHGSVVDGTLAVHGLVISLDGQQRVEVHQRIPWTPEHGVEYAEQLGVNLAEQALTQGADQIIRALNNREHQYA